MTTDRAVRDADVLVVGGGPAGAWAAWSAATHGARVVLADKGYLGSSGATAPGGSNLLYLPPDAELREQAVARRMVGGGALCEPRWIHRVLDDVYESLKLVERWGYPFVRDDHGQPLRNHLQGPEYMRLMRRVVRRAGVTVLDQSPALELLADRHGVGGARGVDRLSGAEWEVRAPAVVLATGGCAFLSKGLGCNVLTGDGLLMAAEAGAELSGMEFSNSYGTSAEYSTVTRNRLLSLATITAVDGTVVYAGDGALPRDGIARALRDGPVHAVLDRADTPEKRALLRTSHAVFFLPYDRRGIDPFTQRFPLTMRFEGTVRGTGGIRLVGDGCETSVPGLYAAGDAASRERSHGGQSGGGAFNASWAICSGRWSGAAAAAYGTAVGPRTRRLAPIGGAGVRADSPDTVDTAAVVAAVQRETLPLDVSYFRTVARLRRALAGTDALWPAVSGRPEPGVRGRVRSREAAAMVATARWMHVAALARTETRGMHVLAEHPAPDPRQRHRLVLAGLDRVTVRTEEVPA
ncbi:succinate dehydrogenase/fumarate reductase flavoprotein subunit [Micromonospora sp. M71_S20]|uniref:FAD-dependent oxidoreductase n=1 Tax=Micromonospora sp. M71_S20 TaxID=592872 RepID=UPI000EB25D3D|nr:FAD-binding protein [Micromonospora sp. M71_S20]RLK22549.1 succinate dehydrogenase/fumarate reductase flavoprotein subunit [Micromonospora sp. M71_S20]